MVSLNKALLGPYFLGGVALGGVPWVPMILEGGSHPKLYCSLPEVGVTYSAPFIRPPQFDKGLIAGLIKGNQWVNKPLIRPYLWGGYVRGGLVD